MELNLKAYAKVNLALDVLRRRPDGYHDVKMIMQNISLYDELTFCVEDEDIKKFSDISDDKKDKTDNGANKNQFANYKITLTANSDKVPTDERNLIYKAVKLMFEQYNIAADIKIHLEKHIPVEAGMAGGSTDCAAAIKALNELFSLGLSENEMITKCEEYTVLELSNKSEETKGYFKIRGVIEKVEIRNGKRLKPLKVGRITIPRAFTNLSEIYKYPFIEDIMVAKDRENKRRLKANGNNGQRKTTDDIGKAIQESIDV